MVPPSEFHFFFALHGKIKYYHHELHEFFSMHNAQCTMHNSQSFFTTNFTNYFFYNGLNGFSLMHNYAAEIRIIREIRSLKKYLLCGSKLTVLIFHFSS